MPSRTDAGIASTSPPLLVLATPDHDSDHVTLPDGWEVARRFGARIYDRDRGLTILLRIFMDGTTATVEAAQVLPAPGGQPYRAADLATIPWASMVDAAVAQCMWEVTPERGWRADDPRVGVADLERAHGSAVRARRGRVTPELLSALLALYEAEGIGAVMTKFRYSERNARRLVARAQGRNTR